VPSFGTAGVTIWDWGFNNSNMIGKLIANRRGGYVTCGHAIKSLMIGQSIALAEFTAQGQPDTSIGYQGRRLVNALDPVADCQGLAYDGNGKLFIGAQDESNFILMGID
jgi:hypothetical protein